MKVEIYSKPQCPYCDMAKALAEREEHDLTVKMLDVDFYHRIRMNHGHPHIIPEVLVANRDHDDRISSNATSKYDCMVEHPEGGWLMNSKELQYVREKYSSFFPHRKYPDEN